MDIFRVAIADSDAAHVDISLYFEVALVSPVSAPRVFYYPVFQSWYTVYSISNGDDGMVNIGDSIWARNILIDSSGVVHEIILHMEANRDWSICEYSLQ